MVKIDSETLWKTRNTGTKSKLDLFEPAHMLNLEIVSHKNELFLWELPPRFSNLHQTI